MASTYTRCINHGETFDEGVEDNAMCKMIGFRKMQWCRIMVLRIMQLCRMMGFRKMQFRGIVGLRKMHNTVQMKALMIDFLI
jgi:hypothetical protein